MQYKTLVGRGDAETLCEIVYNGETSQLDLGTPVCYAGDGTDDGSKVVLPSTQGATKAHTLVAGIVSEKNIGTTLPKTGLVQKKGYCPYTKLVRATRAATTDSWASQVAIAVGDVLVVDTVANALSRTAAGAASAYLAAFVAMQSLASAASAASTTSETRTAITSAIKTFLRVN